MEKTLFLIKPDLVKKQCYGNIIQRILDNGLDIGKISFVHLNRNQLSELYHHLKEQDFFEDIVTYMTSGRCLALSIVGDNAVSRMMTLTGVTDPLRAHPTSLRGIYGQSKQRNGCHRSDSPANASKELDLIFGS